MYCSTNFKTKKALKDAIAEGREVTVFAPGLGNPADNGRETVCGPHFPQPHKWYATVEIKNGLIVNVK